MKRWEIYLDIIMEILVILVGAAFLIFVVPRGLAFLWPFVAGWIISLLAQPIINMLERHLKLPKKFGSAIIVALVIIAIVAVIYLLVRVLGGQLANFMKDFPTFQKEMTIQYNRFVVRMTDLLSSMPTGVQNQFIRLTGSVEGLAGSFASSIGNYSMSHMGNVAASMTNGLIGIIVMFFSAYSFLFDKERYMKLYNKFVPEAVKHKIDIFIHNTLGVLGSYCWTQLKLMIVIMAILWIGFMIAGIHYAGLFAIIVGIVDLFPILGTGTVIIPWAVIKMITGDWQRAIILLVIYAICLILKQVLQPKMMGKSMGISAMATIFLIYIGLKWGGIGGMILALIVGMFVVNLYRLGMFDRKIAFFQRRIEMLTEHSEQEEKENQS